MIPIHRQYCPRHRLHPRHRFHYFLSPNLIVLSCRQQGLPTLGPLVLECLTCNLQALAARIPHHTHWRSCLECSWLVNQNQLRSYPSIRIRSEQELFLFLFSIQLNL